MADDSDFRNHLPVWEDYLVNRVFDRVLELADKYPDQKSLIISFKEFEAFSPDAAQILLDRPAAMLRAAHEALRAVDLPMDVSMENAFVRVVGLPERLKIRMIREAHPEKLVALEGMIRSASKVFTSLPEVKVTCLRCRCSFMAKPAALGNLTCPNPSCDRGGPFSKDIEESPKISKRVLQLQENPEGLRGAELPVSIGVVLTSDLVEGLNPGNRVIVNGIVRLMAIKSRVGETLDFEPYLEATSLEVIEKEFEEIAISPEDMGEIRNLSRSVDIVEKVRASIAPSIYGLDSVKEAMALQLMSSPQRVNKDGTVARGDIHILLVGDPGIAKSQLLKYVVGLSPRGVYTSGKSASAAGLTAAAVKDEMTDGRWTIEAGALPMADMGIAAVDEIDKMQDSDRDALHEGLEQQTISVSKAGINATLRCRCAVLAAANPKHGRFDQVEPIPSQIKLMPTLLSRFDLIFVLFDIPEAKTDGEIAAHILGSEIDDDLCTPVISPELLRKYIAYARRTIFPKMTQEASDALKSYYLGVRAQYASSPNQPVPITARQLQALSRLAKASARLRLSDTVELVDAQRAIRLTDECLRKVSVDPTTGQIDADILCTGTPKSMRDRISVITRIIRDLEKSNSLASIDLVIKVAEERGISEEDVSEIISRLKRDGACYEKTTGYLKLT